MLMCEGGVLCWISFYDVAVLIFKILFSTVVFIYPEITEALSGCYYCMATLASLYLCAFKNGPMNQ